MPKRTFKLSEESTQQVHLTWKGMWKNIEVRLDDTLLGVLPDQKALKAGATYPLPDGGSLEVKLKTGVQAELQVSRDGTPLPGSGGDPATKLKTAQSVIYFVGGLTILVGVLAAVANIQFLTNLGYGWFSAVFGLPFLVAAFFVGKRSQVALGLAIALFAIDGIWSVFDIVSNGGQLPTGMVVFKVLLILPMFGGFGAIKALNTRDANRSRISAF